MPLLIVVINAMLSIRHVIKFRRDLFSVPPYDQAVTANPQTPEKLPEGQCPPLPAEIFPFAAEALVVLPLTSNVDMRVSSRRGFSL